MEHIKVDPAAIKAIDGSKVQSGLFYGMKVNEFLKSVDSALSKGDRAEVIRAPNGGVKVIHIQKTLVSDSSRK